MTPAGSDRFSCPKCHTPWLLDPESLAALDHCPRCGVQTRLQLFPALTRPLETGKTAEAAVLDGEATCFYHPQKRALVPCDVCGRFLCALCDLEFNGAHLCPSCLESGAKKRRIQALERDRKRWDQIVWAVIIVPLLICFFATPLTSLGALGLIVWKWSAPHSLVANTRRRMIIASGVAVLEFFGSVVLLWFMYSQ